MNHRASDRHTDCCVTVSCSVLHCLCWHQRRYATHHVSKVRVPGAVAMGRAIVRAKCPETTSCPSNHLAGGCFALGSTSAASHSYTATASRDEGGPACMSELLLYFVVLPSTPSFVLKNLTQTCLVPTISHHARYCCKM